VTVSFKASVVVCSLAVLTIAAPSRLEAQAGSLPAARELYASAEYDQALSMLNGLAPEGLSSQDRQAVDLYRTLCLMAMGNATEANKAIEGIITRDPLYRPGNEDVPPRVRSALSDVRRRLLPSIIQQRYVVAKTAFERQDFKSAAVAFEQVLNGLSDPDIAPVAAQPPLSDLKMLATGFNELTVKSLAPAPEPAPAAPVAALPPEPIEPRVYSAADANVVPPLALKQVIPPYPGRVMQAANGVIEVLIDEFGMVEEAVFETPISAQYDRLTVQAARSWLYRPATFNGQPVKYRKRIQVSLVPTTR
jgi:hypothetical protein